LSARTAVAQDSAAVKAANGRCATALATLSTRVSMSAGNCAFLAAFLVDTLQARIRLTDPGSRPSPRTYQSTRAGSAVAAGTPGQAEAVPGVQPTALAAASISAAGTDSGSKAITAISLNPATLFGGSDSVFAAKWSRFADLTLLVPLDRKSATSAAGLSYFGLRSRINVTAISQGDQLLTSMLHTFTSILEAANDLNNQLLPLLLALDTQAKVEDCVRALMNADVGSAPAECGGRFKIAFPAELYGKLRAEIAHVREVADAHYFGLDLRFDTGDPTLGASPDRDVTSLAVGIAQGQRALGKRPTDAMIARRFYGAARYTKPKDTTKPVVWSGDAGIAFEVSRLVQADQYVQFSGGLLARVSSGEAAVRDKMQPNFLTLQTGLTIPLAGGSSLAVGFSAPLVGKVSPSLSVNFNWGLLLSALPELGGLGR
jgi:hypothetical protein